MANLLPQIEILTQLVAWVKSLFVQPDYAQNDSAQPDFIKNRTHYVENVSTSSVWNQTGCSVGSGSSSPGGYPATFNITTGNKYNVTISQDGTSKTYEGLTAEYDGVFNGIALRKNWSDSSSMSDTSTDALLLVVQPSNVVLRSADIYGENCTVQVSEVTETIHKLDPKYLPDNVNQLDSITTSKSGKVTTVTFEQTNGTETQFQVTDGEDGKSAYQVAVDNGYSGTEAQWLASLKGADGVSLGEVELVQQLSQDDDKVPSAKAVQDGIEVWRDDADIIYKADNIVLDGTNYVDTGIQLLAEDIDWTIEMVVTDVANSYAGNDMFLSCRPNTTYGFRVYKVAANLIRITAYRGSSGNVNINVGTGGVNRITVTKVGRTYTLTCNGISVSQSGAFSSMTTTNPLIIGANVDYSNKGKFTLQSIRIYQSIPILQQYTDHTKSVPFYPKTSISALVDKENVFTPIQSFSGELTTFKISDSPNLDPLSGESFTFIYDKSLGTYIESAPFTFAIYNTLSSGYVPAGADYLYIRINGWQYQFYSKKNGTAFSKDFNPGINGNSCLIAASFNLKTGVAKFYVNGVKTLTDTFNVDAIPDAENVSYVSLRNGPAGRFRIVMNGEISDEQALSMLNRYPNNIIRSIYENTSGFGKRLIYRSGTWTTTGVSFSGTTEGIYNVTATGNNSNAYIQHTSYVFNSSESDHFCKITAHLSLTNGSFTFGGFGINGRLKATIYNSSGEVISSGASYTFTEIGEYDLEYVGTIPSSSINYLIQFNITSGVQFVLSDVYVEIIGAVITLSPYTYQIANWKQYNGDEIPISNSAVFYTTMYRAPIVTDATAPEYPGQLRFYNNNVYIGYIQGTTCVWKQISN
ncbi:MAG: hypothetical protein J6H19_02075 [Bacteroidaceae bacterium]|nr:hypothetical protein [Bacteroidaceae bacterium]